MLVRAGLAFTLSAVAMNASAAMQELANPEVFAPGIISGPAKEDSATFAPDGDTVYFDRAQWPNALILVSHRVHGVWSAPVIAAFSGQWLDHDPAMAPDGSFLVFASNRPATAGGAPVREAGNLWRVERKGADWGEPARLSDAINRSPKTYAPSIAGDGSLYYQQADPTSGEFHLLRAQYRDGRYAEPLKLSLEAPGTHELDPAIAPDESFIVFDANTPSSPQHDRLFIAFREGAGWGKPVDLGDRINARNDPWGAHLGADHHTLYFSSTRSAATTFPRTRAQAEQDLARMQAWDNGNENIWQVSLQPWLDARHG
ncbi:MAG: hypothetical protein ABI843_17365 [Dokdonella sp.]